MPKDVIHLEPKRPGGLPPWVLVALGAVLVAGFVTLLLVGFENILALFRYRVTLFLVLGPVVVIFLWCVWKAARPKP
jgi:uncharacterized BrkB/YihY/UPF0761 family membrane protein